MPTAIFIGRFQPFHIGHVTVIKDILRNYDTLVIGVGSSNESNTVGNPFSFDERKAMISDVLTGEKIENTTIIPIPDVHNDELWVKQIKELAPKIDMVFTGNAWTERCFMKSRIPVTKVTFVDGISGTKIRELIKEDDQAWKVMVPRQIMAWLENNKGVEKITQLQ